MRRYFYLLLFIILGSFFGCDSDPVQPEGNYSVTGSVTLKGAPLEGAVVQIDSFLNWQATSDQAGAFRIAGITSGTHELSILKNIDGRSVAQRTSVNLVNETTQLGEIRLPEPPIMRDIDSTQVASVIPLHWSETSDPEFREYKLYRRDTPGLDELTGELIYVGTAQADTHFVDNAFEAGRAYYYRVYILSAFGKLGGSNFVSVKTPPKELCTKQRLRAKCGRRGAGLLALSL